MTARYMKLRDGTVHRFDASGRLTAIEDRNGNKIVISRQTGGRITSIKEPAGRELVFTYDAMGRVSSLKAPDGRQHRLSYLNSSSDDKYRPGNVLIPMMHFFLNKK